VRRRQTSANFRATSDLRGLESAARGRSVAHTTERAIRGMRPSLGEEKGAPTPPRSCPPRSRTRMTHGGQFPEWARLDSNQGPTDYELASEPRAFRDRTRLSPAQATFSLWRPSPESRRVSALLFATCLPRPSSLARVSKWTVRGPSHRSPACRTRALTALSALVLLIEGSTDPTPNVSGLLAGWVDFYNRRRSHTALGGRPPISRL